MINEKKLLCAFIYSAYSSGYCGLGLGVKQRKEHMQLYKSYIKDERHYPEKEISETQAKMMDHVNVSSVREYIYEKHFDIVTERIETECNTDLKTAINSDNKFILHAAVNCPVNFYEVTQSNGSSLLGKNIFSGIEKKLFILEGLEKPEQGDLISGHWDFFLERVDKLPKIEQYKKISLEHYKKIKKSLRKIK